MDGSDSKSASSTSNGCDITLDVLGSGSRSASSSKNGSEGIFDICRFKGGRMADLSDDARVVIERGVLIGGNVGAFGFEDSAYVLDVDVVREFDFKGGPEG